jgi:hypothetical protein
MKHYTQFGVHGQLKVLYLHAKHYNILAYVHITTDKPSFVYKNAFYKSEISYLNDFQLQRTNDEKYVFRCNAV